MTLEPTRQAGLERLRNFVEAAGPDYAAGRNYDRGLGKHRQGSMLSAYITRRMVTEEEVVRAVLERHRPYQADKFIQEVCWRTYWKGWLALRPAVWRDYLADLEKARAEPQSEAFSRAVEGRTGIDCFDAWSRELTETGYLHNHARMWFASIWIFTLRLPWTLGADFFYRHLLDADAASNTLSWRWVAGLHTRGKHYAARAENIHRFTEGRFNPTGQLDESPKPLHESRTYERLRIKPAFTPLPDRPAGLLLHIHDLEAAGDLMESMQVREAAVLKPGKTGHIAPGVEQFNLQAMEDTLQRSGLSEAVFLVPEEVGAWAQRARVEQVVTADPGIGDTLSDLKAVEKTLVDTTIPLLRCQRAWDRTLHPHATAGYFRFKKAIPSLLKDLEKTTPGAGFMVAAS